MPIDWYYAKDGRVVGPLSADALRRHARLGQLTADCLVRQGADGQWVSARRVRGLAAGEADHDPVSTGQGTARNLPTTIRLPPRRLVIGGLVLLLAMAFCAGIVFVQFFPGSQQQSETGAGTNPGLASSPGTAALDGDRTSDSRAVREKSVRAEIDRLRFEVTRLEGRERDLRHEVEELAAVRRQALEEQRRLADPVRNASQYFALGKRASDADAAIREKLAEKEAVQPEQERVRYQLAEAEAALRRLFES